MGVFFERKVMSLQMIATIHVVFHKKRLIVKRGIWK